MEDYYWDEIVLVMEEYGILNAPEEDPEDGEAVERMDGSLKDMERFMSIGD